MLGTEGGLRGLWHLLVRMLFADGDNRGTLDPNG
jgi:hypothetical protein